MVSSLVLDVEVDVDVDVDAVLWSEEYDALLLFV